MKIRNLILWLVVLLYFSNLTTTFAQDGNAQNVVDRFILAQAKREGAEEYKQARQVIKGDLNNDSYEDLAVQYTLEGFRGSNNYLLYLAIFINQKGIYGHLTHVVVGGKGKRDLTIKAIKENKIYCDIKEYGDADAICCPSKSGVTVYVLQKNSKGRLTLEESNKKIS